MSKELTDFQKEFLLVKGAKQQLFTQKEFDQALHQSQEEIVMMAIATTKAALKAEREACAWIAENNDRIEAAALIRARNTSHVPDPRQIELF